MRTKWIHHTNKKVVTKTKHYTKHAKRHTYFQEIHGLADMCSTLDAAVASIWGLHPSGDSCTLGALLGGTPGYGGATWEVWVHYPARYNAQGYVMSAESTQLNWVGEYW